MNGPIDVMGRVFSAPLGEAEAQLIVSSTGRTVMAEAGHELMGLDALLDRPKLILSGWVGLVRVLDDGRRQILDIYVAGELAAFTLRPGTCAKGSYQCLTSVYYVELSDLVDRVVAQPELFPNLAAHLGACEDAQHDRFLDQILRVGRLLAHERIAHFALDLHRRHERYGLLSAHGFRMPLTQEMIGDLLGLSTVHVNRTLQMLRRGGVLKTAAGRWQIADMEHVEQIASGAGRRNNLT